MCEALGIRRDEKRKKKGREKRKSDKQPFRSSFSLLPLCVSFVFFVPFVVNLELNHLSAFAAKWFTTRRI